MQMYLCPVKVSASVYPQVELLLCHLRMLRDCCSLRLMHLTNRNLVKWEFPSGRGLPDLSLSLCSGKHLHFSLQFRNRFWWQSSSSDLGYISISDERPNRRRRDPSSVLLAQVAFSYWRLHLLAYLPSQCRNRNTLASLFVVLAQRSISASVLSNMSAWYGVWFPLSASASRERRTKDEGRRLTTRLCHWDGVSFKAKVFALL